MKLNDFISRVDKDTILDVYGDDGIFVYYGKASNYMFDGVNWFVDWFGFSYIGDGKVVFEVRVC